MRNLAALGTALARAIAAIAAVPVNHVEAVAAATAPRPKGQPSASVAVVGSKVPKYGYRNYPKASSYGNQLPLLETLIDLENTLGVNGDKSWPQRLAYCPCMT